MKARAAYKISEVADALLEYLEDHPNNADSKEGITRWWILRQNLEAHSDLVEIALEELVEQGKLRRYGRTDRPIYCLGRSSYEEDV